MEWLREGAYVTICTADVDEDGRMRIRGHVEKIEQYEGHFDGVWMIQRTATERRGMVIHQRRRWFVPREQIVWISTNWEDDPRDDTSEAVTSENAADTDITVSRPEGNPIEVRYR